MAVVFELRLQKSRVKSLTRILRSVLFLLVISHRWRVVTCRYLTLTSSDHPPIVIDPAPEGGVIFQAGVEDQYIDCVVRGVGEGHVDWLYEESEFPSLYKSQVSSEETCVVFRLHFPDPVTQEGGFVCLAWHEDHSANETFVVHLEGQSQEQFNFETVLPIFIVIVAIILAASLVIYRKFLFNAYGLTAEEIHVFEYGEPGKASKLLERSRDGSSKENFHYLPYDKRFEIQDGDLKIKKDEILGSGNFAVVFKGTVKGKEVAVKTPKGTSDSNEHIKALLTELKIMIHIGEHPNIVNLIGAQTRGLNKGQLYIAREYCDIGDLEQYLRTRRTYFVDPTLPASYISGGVLTSEAEANDPITREDLLNWSLQIASGMGHLQSKKVIHGDLACRNVLLYRKDVAKISDFGLSKHLIKQTEYHIQNTERQIPWRWMSIETLTSRTFCPKSDCWSFGVTLWEIFSLAEIPYPGQSWSQEFADQLKAGMRPPRPEYATQKIYEVMQSCWKLDPKSRPDFSALHDSLTKIKNDILSPFSIDMIEEDEEEEVYSDTSSTSNSSC